jgi:hypothetical protein
MDAQSLKSVIEEQAKEAGLSIKEAEDDWVKFTYEMESGRILDVHFSKVGEDALRSSLVEIAIPSFPVSDLTEEQVVSIAFAMLKGNAQYGSGAWCLTGEDPFFVFMHNIPGDILLTYDGQRLRLLMEYMLGSVDEFESGVRAYLAEARAGAKRGDDDVLDSPYGIPDGDLKSAAQQRKYAPRK